MLTYKLDVEERSTWIRTTPPESTSSPSLSGRRRKGRSTPIASFFTERTEKDSYELFYTFDGEGALEQNGRTVTLRPGSALLIDCRTPQRYRTRAGAERWYHLWAHIDGPGVAAMAAHARCGYAAARRSGRARRPTPVCRHRHQLGAARHPPRHRGGPCHSRRLLAEMVGAAQAGSESALGDEAVRRACELIERAYAEPPHARRSCAHSAGEQIIPAQALPPEPRHHTLRPSAALSASPVPRSFWPRRTTRWARLHRWWALTARATSRTASHRWWGKALAPIARAALSP